MSVTYCSSFRVSLSVTIADSTSGEDLLHNRRKHPDGLLSHLQRPDHGKLQRNHPCDCNGKRIYDLRGRVRGAKHTFRARFSVFFITMILQSA
jgi:hypothetical protein